MRLWIAVVCIFSFQILIKCPAFADDLNKSEKGDLLRAGLLSSREKLLSGICEVKYVAKRSVADKVEQGEAVWSIAFDQGFHRLRFDCVSPSEGASQFARDGIYSYQQVGESGVISKSALEYTPTRPMHQPMDLRMIGISSPQETIFSGKTFESQREKMLTQSIASYSEQGDEASYERHFKMNDGRVIHQKIVVCKSKDYFPISFERTLSQENGSEARVLFDIKVTPTQVSGVWVPGRFVSRESTVEQIMDFKWTTVNEAVPDSFFSPVSFKTNDTSYLFNYTTKEPLLERVISKEMGMGNVSQKGSWIWPAFAAFFGCLFLSIAYVIRRTLCRN